MRHFLFEDKPYEIRLNFRKRRDERDAAAELLRNLRRHRGGGRSGGRGVYGRRKTDTRQKCVSKMQYSNSIEAHRVQLEKYLSREGTGLDGGQAALFGTDINEYRANMAAKNFRIFLSPQNPNVDLKALTDRFVRRLELQTGYKLFWQGACHYNTAHPHAHLLINGVDKLGREVQFPRDIVKTFMREIVRDICTAQVGNRTKRDIEIEREAELSAPRFTRLDERVKELCAGTFRVNTDGAGKDKERVLKRLETLRRLKLANYENGGYKLSGKWEENLKANGRYNTFLKARSILRHSPASSLRVYSGASGEVTGKAVKVYRTDGDASDNHAVVLEGLDGKAYFVPLFKKPEARDGKTGKTAPLAEGEYITLKTYSTQGGRLTPYIFKKDISELQAYIKKNSYTGKLAIEIAAVPAASGGKTRGMYKKSANPPPGQKEAKTLNHGQRNKKRLPVGKNGSGV